MAVQDTPSSPANPTPPEQKSSDAGVDSNIVAFLAYLFGWVSGVIIYLIEKKDPFVRFAAMQSIVFSLSLTVLVIIYSWIIAPILIAIDSGVVMLLISLVAWGGGIGFLILWVMLMLKAYQGKEWELPVIGKLARNFVK